MPVLTNL